MFSPIIARKCNRAALRAALAGSANAVGHNIQVAAGSPRTCIHPRLQSDSADVGLSPRTYWGFYRLAKALHAEMMKGRVYA
jgi:hypothetical protein